MADYRLYASICGSRFGDRGRYAFAPSGAGGRATLVGRGLDRQRAGVHHEDGTPTNPQVVSERLGHANIAITLDTYSHVLPALQEDAAAKVAALIFGTT